MPIADDECKTLLLLEVANFACDFKCLDLRTSDDDFDGDVLSWQHGPNVAFEASPRPSLRDSLIICYLTAECSTLVSRDFLLCRMSKRVIRMWKHECLLNAV